MADMRDLTRKMAVIVTADTQGLKDIAGESKKAAGEVEKVGKVGVSTFSVFQKQILSTNMAMLGLAATATGVVVATTAFGAAILSAAKAAAEYGAAIEQVRIRTGLSAENISFMAAVAKENEATLNDIALAARGLNLELAEFAKGGKSAIENFAQLGLGASDFARAGYDLDKILPLVIERLAGVEDQSQKVALAWALFGRNGDKLLPTFEAIAAGGDDLKKTIKDLGLVIDDETASAAARFNQSLERLQGAMLGIKLTIGNEFIPILTNLLEKLTEWVASNREIIGQNMKSLVDGLVLSAQNLNTTLGSLTPTLKGIPGEFNAVTVAIVALNESLILLQKLSVGAQRLKGIGLIIQGNAIGGLQILRASQQAKEEIEELERSLNQYIATQRGTIVSARESGGAISSMATSVDEARVILDRLNNTGFTTPGIIKGAGDQAGKTAPKVSQLAEEINRLVLEIQKIGKSPEEIVQLEAEARRAIEPSRALVDLWEQLSLIQIRLGKEDEFLKSIDEITKRTQEQTSALGASNAELRQMTIDALRARLALEVFSEEGIREAEEKLRLLERALIDLDLKRTAMEAGDAFRIMEEEFGLLPEKVDDLKNEFDSLGPFIGQVTSDIAQTFSDMFDKLSFDWKSLLNNLKRAFFDFVGAIIANPIRLALDATLGGGKGAQGAAQQGAGLLSGVTGLGGTLGLGSSGFFGASGSFTALGALFTGNSAVGFGSTLLGAIPAIGAIITAGFIGASIIMDALKKTPRLDMDFDSVKTDIGRRAALVNEFLDPEFFEDQIAQISVKRKAGLGVGGDEKIIELIQGRIADTIETVQGIINRLPAELAASLNDSLLNAVVDIETVVGGERLLEFDAKGKQLKSKFEAFINGELQAKFLFAIRDFFTGAFESLGVLPENAQAFIDAEFERFKAAGSREERAAIGQDLLASFDTFVNAFNVISGNGADSINAAVNQVQNLSRSLGFDAIPSLEELRLELGRVVENAEIDPEVIQSFIDLRAALLQLQGAVLGSISSIISNIQSLNSQIVSFGGSAADLTGFLNDAIGSIQGILAQGGLSLDEQEALLGQLGGFVNQMLAEEQAAFQKEQEAIRAAAEAAAEAQRAGIQMRIDSLNAEKDRISEAFRARIDALNEELRIAEQFARLAESVRDTLDSILFSPESVLTGVEQVNVLQGRINALQSQLGAAKDPEAQLRIGEELRSAFETMFRSAGDAFGVNSPEFVSIFDQVTGGLTDLATLTENSGRSVEEIQAEIERLTQLNNDELKRIDASIQAAQQQLASIQTQTAQATFQASEKTKEMLEFLRTEYIRILEERFKQLGEINATGFTTELEGLSALAVTATDQLVTLKDMSGYLAQIAGVLSNGGTTAAGVPGFASGSGGIVDFGKQTLAFLHGREAILTESQIRAMQTGLINSYTRSALGEGSLSDLTKKLARSGYVSNFINELPRSPEQIVQERTVNIANENSGPKRFDVYIHSDNPATVQTVTKGLVKELANEMKKQIDTTAQDLRGAVQNASRKAPQ